MLMPRRFLFLLAILSLSAVSCDIRIQVVEEPVIDTAVISFSFFRDPECTSFIWPFEKPAKNEISNSGSSASFPGQTVDFTLPQEAGGYTVSIFSTRGIAKNAGSKQGLKWGGTVGDHLTMPALPDMYLSSVAFCTGVKGDCGAPCICTENGDIVDGGDVSPDLYVGDTFVWKLYGTERNTPYRMSLTGTSGIMIRSMTITYCSVPNERNYHTEVKQDTIPDFSRVGYHYGDKPIPDVPVRVTLSAPAGDASALIQSVLDTMTAPGALLLKAGQYQLSKGIQISRSGIVLRGEGDGTVLYSTSHTKISSVVNIGISASRKLGERSEIIAAYVPAGQMWVPVEDPSLFTPGDKVFIYRPATAQWLDAIHMREIAQRDDGSVTQWAESAYGMWWERQVVSVEGDRIWLDNPVVMGIGGEGWGIGYLYKGSWSRISECGIENLLIDTVFDPTEKSGGDFIDEDHAWDAIRIRSTENSWVRNVTSRHMGMSCVSLREGAKHCTVSGCRSLEPVSEVTGSRRYAFCFDDCQMCLVTGCFCDDDRHQYVTGGRVCGPNVFHRCSATHARSEAGPHQRWSTGVLYDNVRTDGELNIHDRANYGSGHGWTSANVVLYNCEAASIVCQSPWASAVNWAIGCIGTRQPAARAYDDDLGPRPDGRWISAGTNVSPESLYESQLSDRHSEGIFFE